MGTERGEELGLLGEGHGRELQFFLLGKAGEVLAGSQE